MRILHDCFLIFDNLIVNYSFIFQASSRSSFKSSPLPKLNALETDEISRQNSPSLNNPGLNSSLTIKQEPDMGHHTGLPPELLPVSYYYSIFTKFIILLSNTKPKNLYFDCCFYFVFLIIRLDFFLNNI